MLTTAGGLVFYGTPEGYLQAVDDTTGEVLWKYNTGSGVVGSPITWEQDGEQYVAVTSGWGGAVPLWGGDVAKVVQEASTRAARSGPSSWSTDASERIGRRGSFGCPCFVR